MRGQRAPAVMATPAPHRVTLVHHACCPAAALQVAEPVDGRVPRWGEVLRGLLQEEGARGLLRGAAPRMASSAMWGTAMVSTYEFLKRICALPEDR